MYDPLAQCLSNKDNLHPGKNICLLMSLINFIQVIINDCPIVVGVENPHKFGMCR
jgi:hypothetical protein